MKRPDLLAIRDLGRDGIDQILGLATEFAEIGERPIPKVPALRGKTIATVFYENSTRTRISFETAAKRLSADTMTLTVASSSVQKGESLRDTVETLDAMGVDAFVVRHPSSGAPQRIAGWVEGSVINAGDGQHEHPSQALVDCFTMQQIFGFSGVAGFEGLRVAIVGDIRHSRVARSNVLALEALGAVVTLVAPRTLLPPEIDTWPVQWSSSLDEVLGEIDVCYVLRLQLERMDEHLYPSLDEYHERFGLTAARAARLPESAAVFHPGPMIRGIEIDDAVASGPRTFATRQVRNGVSVRMAILFSLLGAPVPDSLGGFDLGIMSEERDGA